MRAAGGGASPPGGYEAERDARCQRGAVATCVLAILLLGSFAFCDRLLFPAEAPLLLRLRAAFLILLVLLAVLLRRPSARNHALGTGILLGLVLGTMVDVLVVLTGGEHSPYYAGNSLVLMGLSIMIPWPPLWALLISTLIVAVYAVTVTLAPVDPMQLAIPLAFLGSTTVIAVVASALGERLRRQEYDGRVALSEALQHKSEFLASVSHDLRTPLNVVIGYSQLLAEETFGPLTAEQTDALERIIRTSTMQIGLINDLLDLARIEQGKVTCNARAVPVTDLVPQLRDLMDALLRGRPIRFEADVSRDAVTWADPERLCQILSNLLANAAKFTDAGHVRLAARRDGASVRIAVSDSGAGMAPEFQARATEAFVRGTAQAPGWGLGLAIVDRLVRLLEGTLEIHSSVGTGTTVEIRLPLAPDDGASAARVRQTG